MKDIREIRHFHVACGLGGGARGFNRSQARIGNMEARYRCIGGVDVDAKGLADFGKLAGTGGTVLDLFDRQQYVAYNGHEPPAGWREATPQDMQVAAGGETPHIVFSSLPCKGFSGLLSETRSKSSKYQALNRLALRATWLMLEAWKDDLPEFLLFENVPRIATRGRALLDQITQLLRHYGYAVAETTYDCGEIAKPALGQSRKRFLLVARNVAKVPPYLYVPERNPLRAVGQILDRMPMPGAAAAGPMHKLPRLHWKTWVRLAFVEAGKDWRSLKRLNVKDGFLTDYGIMPTGEWYHGAYGVGAWNSHANTITGNGRPAAGTFAVQDVRIEQSAEYGQLGVRKYDQPTGTVSGQSEVGGGAHAVADPKLPATVYNHAYKVVRWDNPSSAVAGPGGVTANIADPRTGYGPNSHRNKLRVGKWDKPAQTVTGAQQVQGGAAIVADPRNGAHGVVAWNEPAGTVSGESLPSNGKFAVQDVRPEWDGRHGHMHMTRFDEPARTITAGGKGVQGGYPLVADPCPRFNRVRGDHYLTGGHYGVVPWTQPALVVSGSARQDNGWNSVADPRRGEEDDRELPALPAANDRLVCVIRAEDGTWHRPFTTLELAALQGLVDPEEHLELEGLSDSAWRERIGNAVPSPAAQAIGSVMGRAILGAWAGESFTLSSEQIWVRNVAIALSTNIPTMQEITQ